MRSAEVGTKATGRLSASTIWKALASLTVKQVLLAFVLGLALYAYHVSIRYWPWLQMFVEAEIYAFALLLCIAVADRLNGHELRSAPYAIAVVASVFLALPLQWLVRPLFGWPTDAAVLARVAYATIESALLGGAAALVWLHRCRARLTSARMHAAQIERVQSSKRALESRLQAMQARVEPRFLFDTLAQVKALYERDGALGERVLDELIAYLRAAMPRMRDASSAVDQEVELVRAFLSIARLCHGGNLDYTLDVHDEARAARLPPMLLLPLMESLLSQVEAAPVPSSIDVSIRAEDGSLRVLIETRGLAAAAHPDHAMIVLRERLEALYDGRASLVSRPRPDGSQEVVVDIPLEFGGGTEAWKPRPREVDLEA